MTVAYYFGPLEISMAHWKDVVDALLLCAELPLKKIKFVINHPLNKVDQFRQTIDELNASESVGRLSSGLEVKITMSHGEDKCTH